MEEVLGKSIGAQARKGVRMSIPLQEGFSMIVIAGKLELDIPLSALSSMLKPQPFLAPPVYQSIDQEAERLKISERTLRTYLKENGCPFYRLPGGDVRLLSDEVDTWMIQRKVG